MTDFTPPPGTHQNSLLTTSFPGTERWDARRETIHIEWRNGAEAGGEKRGGEVKFGTNGETCQFGSDRPDPARAIQIPRLV